MEQWNSRSVLTKLFDGQTSKLVHTCNSYWIQHSDSSTAQPAICILRKNVQKDKFQVKTAILENFPDIRPFSRVFFAVPQLFFATINFFRRSNFSLKLVSQTVKNWPAKKCVISWRMTDTAPGTHVQVGQRGDIWGLFFSSSSHLVDGKLVENCPVNSAKRKSDSNLLVKNGQNRCQTRQAFGGWVTGGGALLGLWMVGLWANISGIMIELRSNYCLIMVKLATNIVK